MLTLVKYFSVLSCSAVRRGTGSLKGAETGSRKGAETGNLTQISQRDTFLRDSIPATF